MFPARSFALSVLFLPILAAAQYPGALPPPDEFKAGYNKISIKDAKRHLSFLAGPECMGRGTGQPGFQKAADYMAARFKEYGLKPVGANGTYFQMVPFFSTQGVPDKTFIEVKGKKLILGNGWSVSRFGENVDLNGKLVVLSIEGESVSLENANLENAVVVVRFDKPVDQVQTFRIRNAIARAKAAALLFVVDKAPQAVPQISRTMPTRRGPTILSGYIGSKEADALATQAELNSITVGGATPPKSAYQSVADVHLSVSVETKPLDVPNVVGLLEGSDPTLKEELVGVGAHLDHLGTDGTRVYPGADDDGSGSTAILGVAAAFKANKVKPRRSVLFMAFCGEEMGLIGSGWYSDHPIFPHEKMVAELQMDMVGRDSDGAQNGDPNRMDKKEENIDTIRLVGSKRISTELDSLIQEMNRYVGFRFKYDAEDVYTRSDHYNFARQGIPIAFLFDGFHPDYHQTTDTVDKIDFAKLTNSSKLYFMTALRLANADGRPKKDVVSK